jgi:prepilin-type N-terminal cleavage/methylation domain-containing protein
MSLAKTSCGRPRAGRAGFSLVEMLVVMAIIAILVSLTAAGAFQILSSQRSTNTELIVKKADNALQAQWQRAVKSAFTEKIDPIYFDTQYNPQNPGQVTSWGLMGMAGGNQNRARLIWVKLRLMQQFPMSFNEARSALPPAPVPGPMGIPYFPLASPLPLPPLYPVTGNTPLSGATANPATENAALLLLVCSRGGSGITFSTDSLSSAEAADAQVTNGLKMMIDAWGNPLVYYRFPIDNPEITSSNPSATAGRQNLYKDPLDPDGLLMDPTWNNQANYNNKGGVWVFEGLCHRIHELDSQGKWVPTSYFSLPTVVSAGRNGRLGLVPPAVSQTMASDPTADANDNVYGFRLRLGARGD